MTVGDLQSIIHAKHSSETAVNFGDSLYDIYAHGSMLHRADGRRSRAKSDLLASPSRRLESTSKPKISKEQELRLCQALYVAYQSLSSDPSNGHSAFRQVLKAGAGKLHCTRLL